MLIVWGMATVKQLAVGTMVVLMLACYACLQGVTTMATSTTKALATTTKATTAVALAPHVHAQPVLPSTAPAANWQLVGQPSTAKGATNGVGPAPGPKTV